MFFGGILFFYEGKLQYSESVEINKPIAIVDSLFRDIYNMKKYMPGTKNIILVNGTDNEKGAEYKITYASESDSIVIQVMLINTDLPDSLTMHYMMPQVLNIVTQKHEKISENQTLVINKQEFQFKGMGKIWGFLMPTKILKEQTQTYLKKLKDFLENAQEN